MSSEQDANFQVLKVLEQNPEFTQRQIAKAIGLSLGKTNYILHALMEKGFLKVGRFLKAKNKLTKVVYILTPAGVSLRMDLAKDYVKRKTVEYDALNAELQNLRQQIPEAFEVQGIDSERTKA